MLFKGLPPEAVFSAVSREERALDSMTATERMEYYKKKHQRKQFKTPEDLLREIND